MLTDYPTPETMGAIRTGQDRWFRESAGDIWPIQHLSGSRFIAPPSMPPIRAEVGGYSVKPEDGSAMPVPRQRDRKQFQRLAEYYASIFRRGRMYYISQEMTHLAMRTEMNQYRLTVDMLPSPEGFLVWGQPIGDAEHYIPRTAWLSPDGTVTEDTEEPFRARTNPFRDADVPVIGAAWRYEPAYDQVWLSIYTYNKDIREILIKTADLSSVEAARVLAVTPPLAFEREQSLPLDTTLNWFETDPAEGPKLQMSAFSDLAYLPSHLWERATAANEDVAPQLSAMVRTLIATFMLMKWKIAHREEITAPHTEVKRMARESGTTRAEAKEASKTTVVKLGQPLRHRKPKEGGASGKWKVRAIIGPYIRTRQYIPAWDTYDDTPRLIEPYIAGPEGAPLNNPDKVFLLE